MPQFLRLISFIISLLASSLAVNAKSLDVSTQQYDVKTLSLKNGLLQSSVRGVIQDRQGLIWLGTEAGVQTFDGLHLKRLDQLIDGEVDRTIATFYVNQLLETKNGNILIATNDSGLFSFDSKKRTIQQYNANGFTAHNGDKTPFYQICQDKGSFIWAATKNGLYKLDPENGSWEVILSNPANGRFLNVACIGDHIISRRESELVRFDRISKETKILSIESNVGQVDSLVIKKVNQQYTLIAKHDGLFRLPEDFSPLVKLWPNQHTPTDPQSPGNGPITQSLSAVNDVLLHNHDALWLGTRHLGLILIELSSGKELKRIQHIPANEYSLSGNNVLQLMQDQSKLLWMSIAGVGIDRLPTTQAAMKTYYNHSQNALLDNDITAIAKGPGNNLWFTTNRSGIKRLSLDDLSNENFNARVTDIYQQYVPGELPNISDIAVDGSNRLWFTTDKGIFRFGLTDSGSHFFPLKLNNLRGPRVRGRDIFIDMDEELYVTDQGAILRYDPIQDDFDRLPVNDKSLEDISSRFLAIRQHSDGTIYTLGRQGIYRLTGTDVLIPIVDADRLTQAFNGRLITFAITKNGDFYIGAQGTLIEINMQKPGKPKIINYWDKELPNNYFYAIELDDNGNPWFATNNGIVHFNAKSHEYDHFSLSDGVLVREFNALSSYKLDNGHIIFGGIDGWTRVTPDDLVFNDAAPQMILTSYQIGSREPKPFLPKRGIKMAFSEHWLQFSFSAMDYGSPQDNRFAYFLQGFDPDWRTYGNKSTISFTGLPPGNYTLHARAATKRGEWPQQTLSIPIVVELPFYRSILAFVGYALLFIALGGTLLWRRYKLNHERAHYIDLIEISEERMKLALWGSDNSLWDWQVRDNEIYRTSVNFLGYGEQKIAGTIETFKALIHPDDLPLFEYEINEVLLDHTAEYSAQYRLKAKDGKWHWIADQGKVVERAANHKPIRLSGTIKDVSQLKQHEEELETLNQQLEHKIKLRTQEFADQNNQLSETLGTLKNAQKQLVESEKMASLGNLVTGISHEINTPVGVALTAATTTHDTIKRLQGLFYNRNLTVNAMKNGLSHLMESNELVESSINRTAQLIQTFKQVAADHNHHEWRIIELPYYLIDVVPTFNFLLADTEHKLIVIDNDFFDVECSPGDLYQIVSQLVNNSLAHGFCQMSSGQMIIETLKKTDHWILRYSDNGTGLASDALNHIFEPFYTTRRADGYAGLGLHLLYNIVHQQLGGSIECMSEEGQGLTFLLKLPLHKPESLGEKKN